MIAVPPRLIGQKQSLNTHKAALMLVMTGTDFDFEPIDVLNGDHKSADYEALNPFGRVPTLIQGDLILRQTTTILRHLSKQTGQYGWTNDLESYEIENWFGFASDYLSAGLARLRFINRFLNGEPVAIKDHYRPNMLRGLDLLDRHLRDHDWLACGRPTIAEFAVHPMVFVWPDAEVEISDWPAIGPWLARTRSDAAGNDGRACLIDPH